jgi:hypothetical protein
MKSNELKLLLQKTSIAVIKQNLKQLRRNREVTAVHRFIIHPKNIYGISYNPFPHPP